MDSQLLDQPKDGTNEIQPKKDAKGIPGNFPIRRLYPKTHGPSPLKVPPEGHAYGSENESTRQTLLDRVIFGPDLPLPFCSLSRGFELSWTEHLISRNL